ncbi:hypothetical protein ACRAWF_21415 [Streptomyces sp. L7]
MKPLLASETRAVVPVPVQPGRRHRRALRRPRSAGRPDRCRYGGGLAPGRASACSGPAGRRSDAPRRAIRPRTRRRSGGVADDRVRDSADPRPHGLGAGAAFRSRRPRL